MYLGKYRVIEKLGDGTFGWVFLCWRDEWEYAVKVIWPVKRYIWSAKIEADILDKIQAKGDGCPQIIELWRTFNYSESHWPYWDYYCLVFEPLGRSLFDFIKMNKYWGFYIDDIKLLARNIL